mmetsp:Transcript_8991/g.18846  ORF Transcript_8991/g.18846 Transcript_8991/m.18846 type:complete len:83 (-) Transcript_8991:171-419(-)
MNNRHKQLAAARSASGSDCAAAMILCYCAVSLHWTTSRSSIPAIILCHCATDVHRFLQTHARTYPTLPPPQLLDSIFVPVQC